MLEPSFGFLTRDSTKSSAEPKGIVRFEHLKIGLLNFANVALYNSQPYEHAWMEIEAFRLSEDRAPQTSFRDLGVLFFAAAFALMSAAAASGAGVNDAHLRVGRALHSSGSLPALPALPG